MCPPGDAIATPANAIAANAAMSFILFMVWFLSLFGVVCFCQDAVPMSPPIKPPMSDAPISHQSSVWSVQL